MITHDYHSFQLQFRDDPEIMRILEDVKRGKEDLFSVIGDIEARDYIIWELASLLVKYKAMVNDA